MSTEYRLEMLGRGGWSRSRVNAVRQNLSAELLEQIESAKDPNEAAKLANDGLAVSKASIEEVEE